MYEDVLQTVKQKKNAMLHDYSTVLEASQILLKITINSCFETVWMQSLQKEGIAFLENIFFNYMCTGIALERED